MNKEMNVVSLRDVSWVRSNEHILKNINWKIAQGEHWAVLGLNGSGKTSLLHMLNGYMWPTTGTIQVLGKQFGQTDLRELRQSIGWVSSALQERVAPTQLAQQIVVSGKYATTGLYDQPTEEDIQSAYQLMGKLGCDHLIHRPYEICSQGEKQKLLIARGLMAEPQLLILDEPTNGLDFIAREELLASIEHMSQQASAPTIIFVTHHIEEILPLFSHTLLLKEGNIFEQGKSEDVITTERLSQFLERPVYINWYNKRPWMTLQ